MARTTDWESRIGRRVTLRDLHILSEVVRSGSMAKAASSLSMSQSAVSEAIAQLEDAIRVRLLERGSRGIEPTIYADALLRRSHTVFDELQQAVKDIEFLADPTVGEVRIGCPELLSYSLLPLTINHLSRSYPQIAVRVTNLDTGDLQFRILHERSVDFVIARGPGGDLNDELEAESILSDVLLIIAGAHSRWASSQTLVLRDMVSERWVLPPSPIIKAVLKQAFEKDGLPSPSERITAQSIQLRIQLLATGDFLSVINAAVLYDNAKRWSLTALPIELAKPPPWSVIRLKNRILSPAAQLFIQHLREVAKSVVAADPGRNLQL